MEAIVFWDHAERGQFALGADHHYGRADGSAELVGHVFAEGDGRHGGGALVESFEGGGRLGGAGAVSRVAGNSSTRSRFQAPRVRRSIFCQWSSRTNFHRVE